MPKGGPMGGMPQTGGFGNMPMPMPMRNENMRQQMITMGGVSEQDEKKR